MSADTDTPSHAAEVRQPAAPSATTRETPSSAGETPNATPGEATSATPSEATSATTTPRRSTLVGATSAWLPVVAPIVLFGQFAFLGLRPAICESARLADARVALEQRYEQDMSQHAALARELRARCDPMYLERQRRWLRLAPPPR
jgi:hypothetical protein